ncbi:MAG TPA: rhodanese-like domain-containing protein, partial [Armatimonadota bacterium]|nr:rhodanese-like domain-containing protein [Armatimonadota bacterium]
MRLQFLLWLLALAAAAPAGPSRAAGETGLQERGKALFDVHCARCHGADGADTTTYPGAKSLVDVTRRLSAAQVIEKSRGFAAVQLEGEDAAGLLAFLATLAAPGYAHPALLVETDWVARHGGDAGVRLVDMRPEAEYRAGHIPGAVRIEEGPLRNPEERLTYLPRPEVFARMMSEAGIGNDTHVVIYDDQGGKLAARLWYVLNAYGHTRASLVNGGWNKWTAEQRSVSRESPTVKPARFTPKQVPDMTCPSDALLARKPDVVVLDARSPAE